MTKHLFAAAALLAAVPAAAEPASFLIQTGAYRTAELAREYCGPLARQGFPVDVFEDETPGGRKLWFCRSIQGYARAAAAEILDALKEEAAREDAILVRREPREAPIPVALRAAFEAFLRDAERPAEAEGDLHAQFEAFLREAEPSAEAAGEAGDLRAEIEAMPRETDETPKPAEQAEEAVKPQDAEAFALAFRV